MRARLMATLVAGLLFLVGLGLLATASGHVTPQASSPETFRAFDSVPTMRPPQPFLADVRDRLPRPTATPEPRSSPTPSKPPKDTSRPKTAALDRPTRSRPRKEHNAVGDASWYATGRNGAYAAACRPLRQAMGSGWRGRHVIVEWHGRWLGVVLNDFCASKTKLIDVSDEVFRYFSHLSRGVLHGVAVGW